jgi:HAD superfamily hydrolase (TIGR01509 family)
MIKAVVFDLGKVLLDFDYNIAARAIATKGQRVADEIRRLLLDTPLLFEYETGRLTSEQFYSEICKQTGYCGSMGEFSACFADIFSAIDPMVELQSNLRRRGLPCFIFSNTNELAIHHIRAKFPFFANFDGYILSYEHGSMKPEEKLYQVVETESGHSGQEILYIDDRPENIEAGRARGWQVILQETPEKAAAAIRDLGLLRDNGA